MANLELKQKQKDEAIRRMKALKLMGNVRDDFKRDGKVYYSERLNKVFDGILYWLENKPEYVELVKDFESKHNAVVYHCVLSHTCFGDMLAMLYVSEHESEWGMDWALLARGDTYAMVENLSDSGLSEIGMVGVAPKNGGLTRLY